MQRCSSLRCAPAGSLEKDLQENWQRVSSAFPALESAYFAQREALLEQQARQAQQLPRSAAAAPVADAQDGLVLDVRGAAEDHISAFSQDLSHFCRHSKLTVGFLYTPRLCSGAMEDRLGIRVDLGTFIAQTFEGRWAEALLSTR